MIAQVCLSINSQKQIRKHLQSGSIYHIYAPHPISVFYFMLANHPKKIKVTNDLGLDYQAVKVRSLYLKVYRVHHQ